MLEFYSTDELQTEVFAEKTIAPMVKGGDVVALFGPMGAGKTAFTRGLARGLGSSDRVCSPTFAIANVYRCRENGSLVRSLAHFDMYRVQSWDELEQSGFFDYIADGSAVVCEWSENIEGALPDHALRILIEPDASDSEKRKITVTVGDDV